MGLLDRIFGSKKDVVPAKRDYKKYLEEYQKTMDFFGVLLESGMLPNFCDVNGVSEENMQKAIGYYDRAETYVEEHNEACG